MTGDSPERRIAELLALRGLRSTGDRPAHTENRNAGPLAPGQQRLWLLDTLQPGSCQHNVPMAWQLDGPLDEAALIRALRQLVLRHQPLRTAIQVVDGIPQQRIHDDLPRVELVDLSEFDSATATDRAAWLLDQDASTPIELSRPPLRIKLYRLGEQRWTLSLIVHHIAFDDWSSGVLADDLAALYRAELTGSAAGAHADPDGSLPPLPIQYLDWAAAAADASCAADQQPHLDFWRTHLADAPAAIDLPLRACAGTESGLGSAPARHRPVPIPATDLDALSELGRAERCTWFMSLFAGWAALLYRVSGQSDLVVGTPFAQRQQVKAQSLIGYFLNTLALRADLSGDPTFRQLLQRTRATVTEASQHAELPFDHVVAALRPQRSSSRHPLFQVWLAADDTTDTTLALPGITATPVAFTGGDAKFDLALFAGRGPTGESELVLEYDSSRFDDRIVEQLAGQLARLIRQAIADPDARLSRLELLSAADLTSVLHTWNGTDRRLPTEPLVQNWFERQVDRTPDAVAVEFNGKATSYTELAARTEQVAGALQDAGVRPGELVGIAVGRSVGMLAAVLGSLRAGAGYVPLDVSHPAERLSLLLADTAPGVILTDAGTADRLPPSTARLLDVNELPAAGGPAAPVTGDPGSTAYVTYTSGSTGRPKGIVMSHRAVSNLVAWQLDHYRQWLRPGARTLQFASLSFDVSFQEIFSTLAAGGTLVLITEDERRDLHGLARLLDRLRIERLFIPAVALQQVAEGYRNRADLPASLRTVIAGSEQLIITDDLRALFTALPEARLHNEYGPSETHVCTAYTLPAEPADWPEWVPIGRPIANDRIYLLDATGRPVAPGLRGEVHIGGAGLADGYLNRPGLTAAAFVPDPFGDRPGGRLYRTGDIARHLPGGELEFLGRSDSQVKIRGYRVELGEVQATLDSHPDVRASFIRVNGASSAERRLVVYVVPQVGRQLMSADLREYCQARLPDYMVPSMFLLLDKFPLTVNGKVDQEKLPPAIADDTGIDHAEPRDELERTVAELMAALLPDTKIGRDQDFFAIGGHSLLATRLLWAVQDRFDIELTLADFYRRPTVAGLAAAVRTAPHRPDEPIATPSDTDHAEQDLDALFDELLGPAQ